MKGAWVMHTLRSVINNDEIWFEILKEFMVENAKGFANTEDFFNKVNEKTGQNFWYFSEQYFYRPDQPRLDYYQTKDKFYFKWDNVNNNFSMPIDLLVNGTIKRIFPTKKFQNIDIKKHSQIEVMDWKFYVLPNEVNING